VAAIATHSAAAMLHTIHLGFMNVLLSLQGLGT
jgi:hypothetical protein